MKILIACEESQIVCREFRKRGHKAFSNDIIKTSGNEKKWHLKMDVFEAIKLKKWDMIIAFPPCTFLTVTANRSFINNPKRWKKRLKAMNFIYNLLNCDIEKIALENPIGVISTHIRKPDQIIQPFEYGHKATKRTCLWLKNLPLLKPTKIVLPGKDIKFESGKKMSEWYYKTSLLPPLERAKARSKTFKGIAKAMAKQWG